MVTENGSREREMPVPPQIMGTVLGTQGQGIRYWLYGEKGHPIVLCNSLFGSVDRWSELVTHFARTHRLLLWEYQGHGLSAGSGRGSDATVRSFARDALLLLDGVEIDRAIFVGHGFGVQVILEAYRTKPEKMLSIIGISGAEGGRLSALARLNFGSLLSRCLENVVLPLGVPFWRLVQAAWTAYLPLREEMRQKAAGPASSGDESAGVVLAQRIARTDPWIGMRVLGSMLFYRPGSLLPRLSVPVLLLGGTEDRLVSPERYADMARSIPQARLVLLQGCSHQLLDEQPERVNRLVQDFLAEQGLA